MGFFNLQKGALTLFPLLSALSPLHPLILSKQLLENDVLSEVVRISLTLDLANTARLTVVKVIMKHSLLLDILL